MRMKITLSLLITLFLVQIAFPTATQTFQYQTNSFLLRISINGGYPSQPNIELVREMRLGLPLVLGFAKSFEPDERFYHINIFKAVGKDWKVTILNGEDTLFHKTNLTLSIREILSSVISNFFNIKITPVSTFEGFYLSVPESYGKNELEEHERFWRNRYRLGENTIYVTGDLTQNLFWMEESEGKYSFNFGLFISLNEAKKFRSLLSTDEIQLYIKEIKFKCDDFGSIFWPRLKP